MLSTDQIDAVFASFDDENEPKKRNGDEHKAREGGNANQEQQQNRSAVLPMLNVAAWDGVRVPPREWAVRDRISRRAVTLLSGEGGVGKSILVMQLAAAHVLGRDWFGAMPEPGPVIYLNAEDDERELHFRLDAIRAHLDTTFAALKDLHLVPLAGEDGLLGTPDRTGIIKPTPLFEQLLATAIKIKPVLVALDTAADTFGGNENDRSQVRQFIGLLRRLAISSNAAVLLASHPSVSGITTDSGLSGSTGWHNSVRSRMYFKAAKATNGEKPNPDLRELEVRKNNYGPSGEVIRMRWQNGVFVPVSAPSSLDKLAAERQAEHTFLDLLDRFTHQGQKVSPYKGHNYAPSMFADHAGANGQGKRSLAEAMQRLLDAGTIRIEETGPPSKRRSQLVRT
jgi:RecA-family ATPase